MHVDGDRYLCARRGARSKCKRHQRRRRRWTIRYAIAFDAVGSRKPEKAEGVWRAGRRDLLSISCSRQFGAANAEQVLVPALGVEAVKVQRSDRSKLEARAPSIEVLCTHRSEESKSVNCTSHDERTRVVGEHRLVRRRSKAGSAMAVADSTRLFK